mgnify:CR=1 FL=1
MRKLAVLLLLAITLPVVLARRGNTMPDDAVMRRAKAEYALIEAMRLQALDSNAECQDLLQFAYNTDTTLTSAAFHLGVSMLGAEGQDLEYYKRAASLMRRHFIEHPGDYYETMIYGDVCSMVGMNKQSLEVAKTLAAVSPHKYEVMARLARAYTLNYDFVSSNVVYDSIEAMYGRSQAITNKKIANFIAMKDTVAALQEQYSLLATAPDNVEFILETANVLYQLGEQDSVKVYLERAQHLAPDDGNVYAAAGLFYRAVGDSTAFFDYSYRALMTDNLELEQKQQLLLTVARHFYTPGDTSTKAARLFDALIEKHPHEVSFHKAYADYLVACSHYGEAAEQLSYAIDMDPSDIDDWHRLILIRLLDDDYDAAIEASQRAIEYNSDDPTIYTYVGQANFQMKRYHEAIKAYDTAIALLEDIDESADDEDVDTNGEISDLLGAKADAYCALGDTVTAFTVYESSLALNPDNAGILNNYAYMLSLQGHDLDRAETMVKRALMYEPTSATFLDTYAWVLYRKGEYEEALAKQREAMERLAREPGAEMLQHMGDILEATGDSEGAAEFHRLAREREAEE